jgi:bacteriorhodopsin
MSAAELLDKRNNALATNPNDAYYTGASDINITTRGSDWYWAVTAVMAASTIGFIAHSTRVHRTRRVFHYITAAITLTAAIAYFTMASNLGYTPIGVEFHRSDPKVRGAYREIFYVRYIDWVITTPVSLLLPINFSLLHSLTSYSFFYWTFFSLLVSHGPPSSTPSSWTKS